MKLFYLFICLLLLISSTAFSQNESGIDFFGNSINRSGDFEFASSSTSSTDEKVQRLVDEILHKTNASLKIRVFANVKTDFEYALAKMDTKSGFLIIEYSPKDLSNLIQGEEDWFALWILSHEIGHHINNHVAIQALLNPRSLSLERAHEIELEADRFAGGYLYAAGATDTDILNIIKQYKQQIPDDSTGHPNSFRRQSALRDGWIVQYDNNISLVPSLINSTQSNSQDNGSSKTEGLNLKLFVIDDYNDDHRYPDKKYTRCEKKQFDSDTGYIFTSAERIEVDDIAVDNMRGPNIIENGTKIDFSYCISASSTQAVNGQYKGSLYVEIEAEQKLQ